MSKTITYPNGKPYITVNANDNTFSIQLNRYDNIFVVLDKKVIPELIEALKEIENDTRRDTISL